MVMLYTKLKHRMKTLKEFISYGIVDPHWERDVSIFESFHALEKEIKCKMCRYDILAEQYGIGSDAVRKIIGYMS